MNNCHYCQQLPELSNASHIVKSYCIGLGTVFVIAFVSVFVFLLVWSYDHHASSSHHCDQISHTSLLVFSLTTKKQLQRHVDAFLDWVFSKKAASCVILRNFAGEELFQLLFLLDLYHQCLHFTSLHGGHDDHVEHLLDLDCLHRQESVMRTPEVAASTAQVSLLWYCIVCHGMASAAQHRLCNHHL